MMTVEQYKRDTVFLVEASNYERHCLWREFADDPTARLHDPYNRRRVKWEQLSPGSMTTVASVLRRPVTISCFWARLDGHIVLFYSPTSELVDWKRINAWLAQEYAHVPKWDDSRTAHCDAQNFAHCLDAIATLNKQRSVV